MENKAENKFAKIITNFDDIDIKNINQYKPSTEIKNDIIEQMPMRNSFNSNTNANTPKSISILDRTNKLFDLKGDLGRKNEERKDMDMDNYTNKENLLPNNNNFMTNDNNRLNSNKVNYSKYKSNIKEILYQNKNIINNINSIINNSNINLNDDKIKSNPNYLDNNLSNKLIGNKFLNTFAPSQNNNSMKFELNNKDNNDNKTERKTFYNYNEKLENQIGGVDDNYLEKLNLLKNNGINNNDNKIISNTNNDSINNINNFIQNNNFEKKETNMTKTGGFNVFPQQNFSSTGKDFNKNILKEEKKEDYKTSLTNTNNTLNNFNINNNNKLLNNNGYYFNYRNDVPFDKIKLQDDPTIAGNYKMPTSFNNNFNAPTNLQTNINNNYINFTKNDSYLKLNNDNYLKSNINNNNNDNDLKFNNYINNEDLNIKNNYNYKLIDTKDLEEKEKRIKLQIENEEKKLKQLEEEKNKLIKEEKERRQKFYNEINKRENNFNIYENDQLRLNEGINGDNQIKPIINNNIFNNSQRYTNFNINNNENYYNDILKEIRDRNKILNKNALNKINNAINKLNNNYNLDKNITNESTPKRKSLSVNNKPNEVKDYLNNYNTNYLTNDINSNLYKTNNIIENDINNPYKKVRYESEKRYNINSYLKMKDKDDKTNLNNNNKLNLDYNKSKYDQILSSFNDETNKEDNYMNRDNDNTNNRKNYFLSLTPKVIYRNNKFDNYLYNTNPRTNKNDDNKLEFNNNYSHNNINYNSLTQERSYRNNKFLDQPVLSFENIKLKTMNTLKEFSNRNFVVNNNTFKKQNSTRSFSHLNFDLDKDYMNNSNNYNSYIPNSQNNRIFNNIYNTSSNNVQRNNFYNNNTITDKLNTCRCKCSLRKGNSYSNINQLIEPNFLKENIMMNPLTNNYQSFNNGGEKNIEFGMHSNSINRNNNFRNIPITGFNRNNNYFNLYNNRNICEKCARRHFHIDNNFNFGNTFGHYNNMRLCNTYKTMMGDNNYIKRNNYFSFA